MPSLLLIRYVLTAALRDRVLLALASALLVGGAIAVFLGSAALIEQDRFTLVFAGGALRAVGALAVVLFVVATLRRAFEARDVEFLLARPLSRTTFLLSYAAAFAGLAVAAGLAVGGVLWALAPHLAGPGLALWAATLLAEYVLVAWAALFFAMVLESAPGAAMATLGLYVLGRMSGQILGIIDAGTAEAVPFLQTLMQAVSVVIPRLDLMARSSWLIYGPEGALAWPLAAAGLQCAAFGVLLLAAALADLLRRAF
ncbi:MAG TPA: hypothetical protein DDX54_01350 [Rhodospirillaceae bacterium]|jgi:hypothetical protein|nr:hypothetical protein [Alphaproteobacteria bacterium]HBH26039.1 hypothetical protein [Rhodospirillaceae bacterium]